MSTANKTPCVIYVRRSNWNDVKSLLDQQTNCRDYIGQMNMVELGCYPDRVSGHSVPLHRRLGLIMMMEYLRENGIKNVVVNDISRLSRSVMQGAFLLHWFQLLGIVVHDIEYLSSNTEPKILPSQGWDYCQVLYNRLTDAENYYHTHTEDEILQYDVNILFTGRVAPWGFKREKKLPSLLKKDERSSQMVSEVFRIALECANMALERRNGRKTINYTRLYEIMGENTPFVALKDKMSAKGSLRQLDNLRSLKALVQNPLYAGFKEVGKQKDANRVHEYYISVREFNLLNKGRLSIDLPDIRHKSYVSLIRCSCGMGNLNKNGNKAWCHKCGAQIGEEKLANTLTERLGMLTIKSDHTFADVMIMRMEMGRFGSFLDGLKKTLECYLKSKDSIFDDLSLQYKADYPTLMAKMEELIKLINLYNEKGYGELAVEWVEAYRKGRGRQFIEGRGLVLSFDFEKGKMRIMHNNPAIIEKTHHLLSIAEAYEIANRRANLRHEIREKVVELPGLKAILEYDTGYSSGDFWTSFEEMI